MPDTVDSAAAPGALVLDAGTIHRFSAVALAALRRHREEIDGLNVYPVRDHDTGTNLVLTFEAADRALRLDGGTGAPGGALRRMARGALLGAHGNSGVILAQLLGGLADSFEERTDRGGRALAAALDHGVRAAYRAVGEPAEGTVLTVARSAATAALTAATPPRTGAAEPSPPEDGAVAAVAGAPRPGGGEVAAVAVAAYEGAVEALAATRGQLPALAAAGVVDAGGKGLVLLLGALCAAVGVPVEEPAADLPAGALAGEWDGADGSPEYEVLYVLAADEAAVARLRGELAALGDSLVVGDVGNDSDGGDGAVDGGRWQVHVHVDDAGAAVEAGIRAGRPSRIRITRLTRDTHQPVRDTHQPAGDTHRPAGDGRRPTRDTHLADGVDTTGDLRTGRPAPVVGDSWHSGGGSSMGVVVLVEGGGLVGLCGAAGAGVVVGGGGAVPGVATVVEAVRERRARHTVVLPGYPELHGVAVRAAEEARAAGLGVSVVPARSPVQVLAALAVHDPGRGRTEDVIAMAEAAAACRHGRLQVADAEALTMVGRCRPGDVLALADDEVMLIGADPVAVGVELLDRLLSAGGELVTLVSGAGTPDGLVAGLTGHLGRRWPLVEVATHAGGQRAGYLLVGVE